MTYNHYIRSLGWRIAAGMMASILACPTAEAQSFFQSLFGFGGSKPAASSVTPSAKSTAHKRAGLTPRPFNRWREERQQSTRADADGYQRDPAFGGSYRTVCVRMCDGYFWPVSRSVSRERFQADARRCETSCAGEAKLFYASKYNDDPRAMVGLDGESYAKIKNAFLYRRTLISGCGCRPAPWSVAENYRHRTYAAADAAKKAEDEARKQRLIAEALRKDKIAQIIAATEAAIALDAAEETVADSGTGDTTDAVPVASTVTGYVHLHVLPSEDMDLAEGQAEAVAGTPAAEALDDLEVAFAEIEQFGMLQAPSQGTEPRVAATSAPAGADEKKRPRGKPGLARSARLKSKPQQQASWFGSGTSSMVWPGDAPRRKR